MFEYSNAERILHRQFLGNNSLSNFLYKRLTKKSRDIIETNLLENVFITGLARSGTTSLLEKIFLSGNFGSLLYKYMPFILSPSLAYYYQKYYYVVNNYSNHC